VRTLRTVAATTAVFLATGSQLVACSDREQECIDGSCWQGPGGAGGAGGGGDGLTLENQGEAGQDGLDCERIDFGTAGGCE